MTKNVLFVLLILALGFSAYAQGPTPPATEPTAPQEVAAPASITTAPLVDYWKTADECLVLGPRTPFYHPTKTHAQKLGKNEVVAGLPQSGCIEMDLPDRFGKKGFVPIETGRPFVYDKTNGKMLRMQECNNKAYSFIPFPTPPPPTNGIDGKDGANGKDGRDGVNGINGRDGKDGRDGTSYIPPARVNTQPRKGWFARHWKPVLVFAAAVAIGGEEAARRAGRGQHPTPTPTTPTGPGVVTNPPGAGK
ncbi:hypothetical protein HY311_00695 [Candidatus Nomurabacteria bacterium]|nr:hypothetical protein [Candidatus Nomurabacteria bacterium]